MKIIAALFTRSTINFCKFLHDGNQKKKNKISIQKKPVFLKSKKFFWEFFILVQFCFSPNLKFYIISVQNEVNYLTTVILIKFQNLDQNNIGSK